MTAYNYERYEPSVYDFLNFVGPKVGEKVPDLKFTDLNGNVVALTSFRGRQVVLESGSLTCPMYAKDVTKMHDVAERHPDIAFVVMYVREAHPGSAIPAHKTLEDKTSDASRLLDTYNENRQILIDDMEGTAHQLMGPFPNMVYLIDEEGIVAWRASWSDAKSVEAVLDGTASSEKLSQDIVPPTRPTPWFAARVLLRAGVNSLWHFVVTLPTLMRSHKEVEKEIARR
ncbi:MAG: deiodinase-like protein [Acidimicrobiales bacterium]